MKRITAIILTLSLILLSGCTGDKPIKDGILGDTSETTSAPTDSSGEQTQTTTTHPREEVVKLGARLHVCEDLPTEYNGEKLSVKVSTTNTGDEMGFCYLVFVNGIEVDCTVREEGKSEPIDIFRLKTEEEIITTIEFSPINCKVGETAVVSVNLMFDPEYMVESKDYVKFVPRHNITGLLPFEIKINEDCGSVGELLSDASEKNPLSDEERKSYERISADNPGEVVNLLDEGTFFLFDEKNDGAYLTCGERLRLTINALGKEGKYIVGVYINHELVKAFDGAYYSVCNIGKDYITSIEADIDTAELDGLNHIYIIAVPCDPDEIKSTLIHKSETKLLLANDDDENKDDATEKPADTAPPATGENTPATEVPDDIPGGTGQSGTGNGNENNGYSVLDIIAVSNKILVAKTGEGVIFFDVKTMEPVAQAPWNGGDLYSVINDGIVVYGVNGKYIRIYDFGGNLIKDIVPPVGDGTASYCISDNGKEIAYTSQDYQTGATYLYTDSVELNNRKLICEIMPDDKIGTVQGISRILGYDGEKISVGVSVLEKTTPKYGYGFGIGVININGETEWFSKFASELEGLSVSYTVQKNFFVITEDYNSSPTAPTSGVVKICPFGENDILAFACEDMHDNHFAFVSDSGNYIATANETKTQGFTTIKVFETDTGDKLKEITVAGESCDVKFSADEKAVYISAEDGITSLDIKG